MIIPILFFFLFVCRFFFKFASGFFPCIFCLGFLQLEKSTSRCRFLYCYSSHSMLSDLPEHMAWSVIISKPSLFQTPLHSFPFSPPLHHLILPVCHILPNWSTALEHSVLCFPVFSVFRSGCFQEHSFKLTGSLAGHVCWFKESPKVFFTFLVPLLRIYSHITPSSRFWERVTHWMLTVLLLCKPGWTWTRVMFLLLLP